MDLLNLEPSVVSGDLKGINFLFYGGPGTRKTSIAARMPRPVFAQTENGTKFISGVRGVRIKTWGEFLQFIRELKRPEVLEAYDTVVLDRADTLYGYCYDYTLKQLGIEEPNQKGYGAGWKKIEKNWTSAMNTMEGLGYGIVFICHDKDISDASMNVIGTKVKMENTPLGVIRGLVDFIFNCKKEVVDGHQTVIAYSDSMDADTKHRAHYFTDKFEFTFENLQYELELAVQKQVKMEGIQVQVKEGKTQVEERSFEDIRDNVIKLVTKFMEEESSHMADIQQIIGIQLQGKRLSEANSTYYNQMLTIETYLISLEVTE